MAAVDEYLDYLDGEALYADLKAELNALPWADRLKAKAAVGMGLLAFRIFPKRFIHHAENVVRQHLMAAMAEQMAQQMHVPDPDGDESDATDSDETEGDDTDA